MSEECKHVVTYVTKLGSIRCVDCDHLFGACVDDEKAMSELLWLLRTN